MSLWEGALACWPSGVSIQASSHITAVDNKLGDRAAPGGCLWYYLPSPIIFEQYLFKMLHLSLERSRSSRVACPHPMCAGWLQCIRNEHKTVPCFSFPTFSACESLAQVLLHLSLAKAKELQGPLAMCPLATSLSSAVGSGPTTGLCQWHLYYTFELIFGFPQARFLLTGQLYIVPTQKNMLTLFCCVPFPSILFGLCPFLWFMGDISAQLHS